MEKWKREAIRTNDTTWVQGPTGHQQTLDGAINELIYGPTAQLTQNQCNFFETAFCTGSIYFGGEIPEELETIMDSAIDTVEKTTDTADKFLKTMEGPIKKTPVGKAGKTLKDSWSLGKAYQICKAACEAKNSSTF